MLSPFCQRIYLQRVLLSSQAVRSSNITLDLWFHGLRTQKFWQVPAEIVWLNGAPGAGKGANTPYMLKSRGLSRAVSMSSVLSNDPAIKVHRQPVPIAFVRMVWKANGCCASQTFCFEVWLSSCLKASTTTVLLCKHCEDMCADCHLLAGGN